MAEFCVAELGAVLGVSTTAAKRLVGHALELRHRLPRLWAQVHAGRVPAWRARLVAEATIHSDPGPDHRGRRRWSTPRSPPSPERSAPRSSTGSSPRPSSGSTSPTPDPAEDPEDGYLQVDPRHVTMHDDDVHFAGTLRFEAELDLADALDLDRALAHGAATQNALGPPSPSTPAGPRPSVTSPAPRPPSTSRHGRQPSPRRRRAPRRPGGRAPRPLRRHARGEPTVFGPTGRLEEGQRLVLLDQVQSWCADSRTKVTIKPVIDLNTHLSTTGVRDPRPHPRASDPPRPHLRLPVVHPPRPRLRHRPRHPVRPRRRSRRQTTARPDADRQPRRAVPVPPPAQDPHRLALRHGRAGVFEWTSPHGHRYRRDRTGTTALDQDQPPGSPPARP